MSLASNLLSVFYSLAALVVYVCATGYMLVLLVKRCALQQAWLLSLSACAIALHGMGLYYLMVSTAGVNVSIHYMFSLVMFSICCIVLVSSLRKPLHSLFILLLPLSIISLVLSISPLLFPLAVSSSTITVLSSGLSAHVFLSLVAYSLLATAALQSVLLHWQNQRLKNHSLSPLIKHLPPLQTMESLMFELLWVGAILLAAGIVLGAFYIDDMFAQHLVHKTVLSIVAWAIFAVLLWGRIRWGWRGSRAIRWVLVGFCFLVLAYFGSKLVLEVILV